MTPRSLFAIIIKIIGIYLIVGAVVSIPQVVTSLYSYRLEFRSGDIGIILEICFLVLFSISFYVLVLYYCLFKTDWMIDKLHLDHGFSEERFELNMHRSTVLKIAVIVIGAILVLDSLPLLCKQLYSFIPSNDAHMPFDENPSKGWTVYYFVKFFIGFSLMSANRPIVNYIERKRKGPAIKPAEAIEE